MRFGLELEFTAAMQNIAGSTGSFYDYYRQLLVESGVHNWVVHQDNSCGNEIVSPVLEGESGLKQALQACHCAQVARKHFGLRRILGPDCGVHYHFDATSFSSKDLRNVLAATAVLETLFYAMNPASRFDTNFAAPLNFNLHQVIRARDLIDIRNEWFRPYMGVVGGPDSHRHKNNSYTPQFINSEKKAPDKYDWTRYHGFNFVAYLKLGTIEFRYTHGTFDPDVVEMWWKIYAAVVEACHRMMTQTLLKIYPVRRKTIMESSLPQIQMNLFNDLRPVIKFFYKLTKADVPMLKFVIRRLMKYQSNIMPAATYKELMAYNGANPHEFVSKLMEKPLRSMHRARIRGYPE